ALGVATLVSTRILNSCLETAAAATTTPLPGAADLFITNGELGVARLIADDLSAASLPGVATVQPLVFERVTLPDLDGRSAVLIGAGLSVRMLDGDNPLGATFTETLEKNWRTASLALSRRLVALSKPVYDDWVARRPDTYAPFVVRFGSRQVDCLPVGFFEFAPDSPVKDLGRNVVGMELTQAARFAHPGPPLGAAALVGPSASEAAWDDAHPPRVNRVDVRLIPGANPATVQAAVKRVVGDRADVRTPAAQGQATQEIVGGIQIGFALCSAGAMVVGLFLVYNALAVTVAERAHDIGILRSVGATRGQILRLFGAAAVALGVLGAAVGVPLGVGIARAVLWQFREEMSSMFLNDELDPGVPTVATVLLAVAAGVLTATAAALIPAMQAAGQDPADAVRRSPGAAGGGWRTAHRATCATLNAGGVAMILSRHELPARIGAFGGMMSTLIGLLLAAPIIVGVMVRVVHPLLRRILPIEARLAADNLIRSPGRTGVVIGALGAGVAVMVQTAGVGKSNKEPIVAWLDEVIRADRFVFSGNLTAATSSQAPLDAALVRDFARLPGVAGVAGLRNVRPQYNGTTIFLLAMDVDTYAEQTGARRTTRQQELARLREVIGTSKVVVSDNFTLRHGVGVGDTITLPGPRGPVPLEVIGTAKDYSWPRGTIFMDRAVYARLFGDDRVDILHVYLAADSGSGGESVAKLAADRGLAVLDRTTMRRLLSEILDRLNTLAYLQQIVVGVVASLGVVTALLISVLQRKRELGLLLAVGATPAQVVRSVLAEAVLMGAFGTVLGVLIGVPLEWYILRVILVEESGFVFDLLIPWQQAFGIGAGALVVATLAGLLPAMHAVKTRIPEAIAYE
ncbi:MAG: FtsX-like permease family protein, partial [Fimbriiglobus sp.]